jgi:hypothetical protein
MKKGQLGAGDGVGYDLHFLSRLYDIIIYYIVFADLCLSVNPG